MPILRGAVTYARHFAERTKKKPKGRGLASALAAAAFEPLDASGEQDRAAGWVELEDNDSTALTPSRFLYGSHLLATWRVDARRVPSAAVNRELDEWCRTFEEKVGHPPKRADKAAAKEQVLKRLRKRAFIVTRTFDVSWNLDTDEVQIWASSRKIIDEILIAIEEGFGVTLMPTSPGARAQADGLDTDGLKPTPELFGADVASEVRRDD